MKTGRFNNKKTHDLMARRIRSLVVVAGVVVITVVSACIGLSLTAETAEAKAFSSHIAYHSIMIESGDTLWSIAEESRPIGQDIRTYIKEIRAINNLSDDTIHTGSYIIVPYECVD